MVILGLLRPFSICSLNIWLALMMGSEAVRLGFLAFFLTGFGIAHDRTDPNEPPDPSNSK